MSTTRFVILMSARWRAAAVSGEEIRWAESPPPEPPEFSKPPNDPKIASDEVVAGISELLRELGYDGSPVVLGLASSWCVCATIESSGSASRRLSHDALRYQLEDKLPLEIEHVVTDFLPEPDETAAEGGQRLGVCAEIDRLRPFIKSLDKAGITIDVVTPTALLAVSDADEASGAYLIESDDSFDLVTLESGVPVAWSRHEDARSWERAAAIDGVEPQPLAAPFESAAHTAARILDESEPAPCNLLRDALAPGSRWDRLRTPIRYAAAAAMVFLATASALMLHRANQYDAMAHGDQAAQVTVFTQTLPETRVPSDPLGRLRVEHRKKVGLSRATGNGSGDHSGGVLDRLVRSSALHDLSRLLESLPTDRRYRVLEIQIEPDRVHIDGQARELADPDAIAQAIRNGGFTVNPPHTERLPQRGVSFVLSATPGSPTPGSNEPTGSRVARRSAESGGVQ